ncbi:MAG: glycosyltransferase [Acidimicrobiia bacterium]
MHAISYVLPLRAGAPRPELVPYLEWLVDHVDDVLVVDGSVPPVFAAHAAMFPAGLRHLAVDEPRVTPMGKVGGVLTGVAHARHDAVVIADDDVRHDDRSLRTVVGHLGEADVVRPQNYFTELPWHAWWDTGRTLLNRVTGGDWPGTLAVRRTALERTGGYAGDVLFENLELVRTLRAAGGREYVAFGCFVARTPPTSRHFAGQRVRQAADELARPARLLAELALLPAMVVGGRRALLVTIAASMIVAEAGRRRAGGRDVFPWATTLAAPCWLLERAVTVWLAVGARAREGGVRYGDTLLPHAATPMRVLRARALRHAPAVR